MHSTSYFIIIILNAALNHRACVLLLLERVRLLNDYRKKCCKDMNLPEARRAQLKFDDLKNKEMLRQL